MSSLYHIYSSILRARHPCTYRGKYTAAHSRFCPSMRVPLAQCRTMYIRLFDPLSPASRVVYREAAMRSSQQEQSRAIKSTKGQVLIGSSTGPLLNSSCVRIEKTLLFLHSPKVHRLPACPKCGVEGALGSFSVFISREDKVLQDACGAFDASTDGEDWEHGELGDGKRYVLTLIWSRPCFFHQAIRESAFDQIFLDGLGLNPSLPNANSPSSCPCVPSHHGCSHISFHSSVHLLAIS
jgi:hypothetical protein